MAFTYGTTSIPSDTHTVQAGGTVAVSAAFDRTVGVIGGMDTATGTATPGDVVTVVSPSDAQDKFGDGSELHEAIKLIYNNGASEVFALPVAETTTTESFAATASGVLANVPAMDPNIHDEHTITAQDTVAATTVTVNIDYATPPAAPTDADTMNLNPVTGEWAADESSDYDITYDYGDYSQTEMAELVAKSPRMVVVLTENESVVNNAVAEVNSAAVNYDFMHVVAGAAPVPAAGSTPTATEASDYASNYTDGLDEERVSLIAPSRAFIDDAETDQHRTMSGIGGYLAALQLGLSSTNDSVGGYTGLRTDFSVTDASNLIDSQVMPLLDYPPVTIVKDMDTSTTPKFERVYVMQIVDEVTELSHDISRVFIGEQNTVENQNQLDRSHRNMLGALETDSPPLLEDSTVSVTENASNPDQVDIELGLQVVGVMDTISVTLTVGDIVRVQEVS